MTKALVFLALTILLVSLGGCASRGQFAEACPLNRTSVPAQAASAIYFDVDRNQVGKEENLDGTYFKMMCAAKPLGGLPDACPCGTCDTVVLRKHYCLTCSTNPCPPR
jgi:hypothetical protein